MSYKEEWVDAQEAARILTSHTDHTVTDDYVRMLAVNDKITVRKREGQEDEYLKIDVEGYRVMTHLSLKVKFRGIASQAKPEPSEAQPPLAKDIPLID